MTPSVWAKIKEVRRMRATPSFSYLYPIMERHGKTWKDMKRKHMLALFSGFIGIQVANYGITEKTLCINIQHSDPMKNIREPLGGDEVLL